MKNITLTDIETYNILNNAKKQMKNYEKIIATQAVLPSLNTPSKKMYKDFTWRKPLSLSWNINTLK